MRWRTSKDGYKKRFAILPQRIDQKWVWLEFYYSDFCGTHFSVLTVEQYESGDYE